MESVYVKINEYFKIQNELRDLLSYDKCEAEYKQNKKLLYKLVKDSNFEPLVFEILLKLDQELSDKYLKTFYLDIQPENLAKYKSNLDIMLDDYREILGEDAFKSLLDLVPESVREFPPIKEAIAFANN